MVEPFLSMSKMSSRESAMTFFGALPKPLNFDQKPLSENRSIVTKTPDTERNTDANSKIGRKWLENMNLNINFVNKNHNKTIIKEKIRLIIKLKKNLIN